MEFSVDKIPVYIPWMGEEEAQATHRPILSGWVTQGPEVAAFEQEFGEFVGAPHAIAVANCTVALHLALHVLGVGPGDEVITVSHSFIATANAIRYTGATPVFVDIDPATFNMSPSALKAAISGRTKAILAVHQIGMPADLESILQIAGDIPVVEDAACAAGSLLHGEKIGKPHGLMACFSFHPRKLLTTGDGGMITTRDPALAARLRLLRQHSMNVPDTVRHQSSQVVFESYPELGFNYRLTDIQAAVGRVQLKRLPELVQKRRAQVEFYRKRIDLPFQKELEGHVSNWQSVIVRLPDGLSQKDVMQQMQDEGIATRRGIMNAHQEPAYADGAYRAAGTLAESERARDRCLLLPLYHLMTEAQQERVADALMRCLTTLKKS